MLMLDRHGELIKFLNDPQRKIPEAHLKRVCKVSHSGETCRYLAKATEGWWCAKKTPLRKKIDEAARTGIMNRNPADNCDGFGVDSTESGHGKKEEQIKTSRNNK